MGTLFASLQTASSALSAFSRALGVDETNVSNSSTPGFVALRASIEPVGFGEVENGGQDSIDISPNGDSRLDAVVRAATAASSAGVTTASYLQPVNGLFDITGNSGLLGALRGFSAAFSNLSVTPGNGTLQSAALSSAEAVASSFRSVVSSLDSQKTSVDADIKTTVASINQIAGRIRQYNISARGEPVVDPGTDSARRAALDQLSSLVDITVANNPDGSVSVLAGGQQPLVAGDQIYSLSANPDAADGSQIASSGGGRSPAAYSGQLGALLQVRNGTLAPLLGSASTPGTLNTFAKGFADRVNTILTAGVTGAGIPGVPLFTYTSTSTDSTDVARTLAIDPAVTADQIASGSTGASAESNGAANSLAALASSNLPGDSIAGESPTGLFSSIAASVGQQLADAETGSATAGTALTSAQANRTQQTGVSLDQEAVSITAYQRAYEASAKLIGILDQLTSDAVGLIK